MLEAIAADEAKEKSNIIGLLKAADIKDLALLIALLPRDDPSVFNDYLSDLVNQQLNDTRKLKQKTEADLWCPGA